MIQPCMGVTASTPLAREIWPILRKMRLFTRRSWAGMTCGVSQGGATGVQQGSISLHIVIILLFVIWQSCECSEVELFHIKLFDTGLLWTKKRGLSTLFCA